jgi:hypothetical protein
MMRSYFRRNASRRAKAAGIVVLASSVVAAAAGLAALTVLQGAALSICAASAVFLLCS